MESAEYLEPLRLQTHFANGVRGGKRFLPFFGLLPAREFIWNIPQRIAGSNKKLDGRGLFLEQTDYKPLADRGKRRCHAFHVKTLVNSVEDAGAGR